MADTTYVSPDRTNPRPNDWCKAVKTAADPVFPSRSTVIGTSSAGMPSLSRIAAIRRRLAWCRKNA